MTIYSRLPVRFVMIDYTFGIVRKNIFFVKGHEFLHVSNLYDSEKNSEEFVGVKLQIGYFKKNSVQLVYPAYLQNVPFL